MSDQSKLALLLSLILGVLLLFAMFSTGSSNKNFGKVITEYQTHGKSQQVNPEDISKGLR